jgi:hypothetical protein
MSDFGDNVTIEFVTGACAAVIDCCCFHTIDTLKVRSQDKRPLLPWDKLKATPVTLRPWVSTTSLYQGFSTNLFLKVPYMASLFGFHSLNRKILAEVAPEGSLSDTSREMVSAFGAGIEASLLLSPLELIRIQGQNCGKGGLWEATRYCYNKIGLSGLLSRGMHACMQRESKYCLGQFAFVGVVHSEVTAWAKESHDRSALAKTLHDNDALRTALASIVVGFLCTIVSHPDDVLKTQQQTRLSTYGSNGDSYRSYLSAFRHVAQNDGMRTLWRGAVWRCCVRVPLGLTVINTVHPRIRPYVEVALGSEVVR